MIGNPYVSGTSRGDHRKRGFLPMSTDPCRTVLYVLDKSEPQASSEIGHDVIQIGFGLREGAALGGESPTLNKNFFGTEHPIFNRSYPFAPTAAEPATIADPATIA